MPIPSAWTMVELRWAGTRLDGSPLTGVVEVLPYVPRFRISESMVLSDKPLVVKLVDGAASLLVPATDDPDVIPEEFTYLITEKIDGFPEISYHVEAPRSVSVSGVNISEVAPMTLSKGLPVSLVTRKEFDAIKTRVTDVEVNGGGGGGGTGGTGAVASVNTYTGAVILTQDDVGDGPVAKQYTVTEKNKLAGISAGATVNASNATLLSRSSHTGTQTSSTISDFTESVQDAVAALLTQGTGVTLSYNDAGNTLTVTSTGTGGVTDPEVVRDTIGAAMIGVGLIGVAVNDAADTITITTTATANQTDAFLLSRANHTGTQAVSTIAATGTRDATTYLRGDGTWSTVSSAISSITSDNITDATAVGKSVLTSSSADVGLSALGGFKPVSGAKVNITQDFTVATAARAAGTRTDVMVRWRGPVQPNNMITGDEWTIVGA